jgi:hypothetical protein
MAGCAVVLELAKVGIFLVAVAALPEGDVPKLPFEVTLAALDRSVLSRERIPRPGMIETGDVPGRLPVTARAVGAERRPVRVAVAIRALRERKPLPLPPHVAFFANDLPVRAHQRKRRLRMVEPDLLEGNLQRVAAFAVLPELAPVDVFVAGDATRIGQEVREGILPRHGVRSSMTALAALDLTVEPDEIVASLRVIEPTRIPLDEGEVTALMVRVADRALSLVPMETTPGLHSLREVLVAGETLVVPDTPPRRVAGRAVAESRELLVRAAQRAGGDEAIEVLAASGRFGRGESERHHDQKSSRHQASP